VSPPGAKEGEEALAKFNAIKNRAIKEQPEREAQILKSLKTPEEIAAFKAGLEERNKTIKLLEGRSVQPCQPLTAFPPVR
jgi:uncharacterized membrane protein